MDRKQFNDLTPEERAEVLTKAGKWKEEHPKHVENLIQNASGSYDPSGSDLFRPELWKAAHWRWFSQLIKMKGG